MSKLRLFPISFGLGVGAVAAYMATKKSSADTTPEVFVYVLDSNIQEDHPVFTSDGEHPSIIINRQQPNRRDSDPAFYKEHGTAVASVVATQYKSQHGSLDGLHIVSLNTYGAYQYKDYNDRLIWAMDDCAKRKASNSSANCVLNSSISLFYYKINSDLCPEPHEFIDDNDKNEYFKIQDNLVKMAKSGIVITRAAGNDAILSPEPHDFLDDDKKDYYKNHDNMDNHAPIFVVGGIDDSTLQIAEFSNFGPPVNVYESAVDIKVASSFGGYRHSTGTSLAAPIVAANIAYLFNQVDSLKKLNEAFNAKYKRKPVAGSGTADNIESALNSTCLETRMSVIFSKPAAPLKPVATKDHLKTSGAKPVLG